MPTRLHPRCVAAALSIAVAIGVANAPAQQPTPGARALTRIAFGSCAREDRPQPIWETVLSLAPDLFVFAGDNVYNDTEDPVVMRRKWAALDAIEGFARLRTKTPILGTWDDHDYGADDAGRDFAQRDASQAAFLDFLRVPADSPRRTRKGVYHAEIHGPPGRRVQVILLDTRYHRSPLDTFRGTGRARSSAYRPSGDRDQTMLGDDQWAWLEARLREPAELRLIVSSVQFVAGQHRFEKWMNLPRERSRMLRLLDTTGATGVLFLSGDRHHAELSRLDRGDRPPIYDLTASGLNQSVAPKATTPVRDAEPNLWRVGRVFKGHHFGVVEVDWSRRDPLVRLSIVDRDGARPIDRRVRLSRLGRRVREVGTIADAGRRPDGAPLVIDGCLTDWPTGAPLLFDDDHLYAAFTLPDVRSIGRHRSTVRIEFDVVEGDGDPGADLAIEYSPRTERRRRRPWEPVITVRRGRDWEPVHQFEQAGFHGLPTHASDAFELRLDRRSRVLRSIGLDGAARLRLRVTDSRGAEPPRLLADATTTLTASAVRPSARQTLPDRAPGAIRVVSLNVLWSKPQENPAPFGRVLGRLAPDIVLVQEWDRDRYSAREIAAWFAEHVDAGATWSAMVTGATDRGQGTAVVTRHPILARAPAHVPVIGGRWDFPMRLAAAAIDTPAGVVLASSLHLKAAGSLRSEEDERRLAEARAANVLLRGMAAAIRPSAIVVGGDLNIVGTPAVLPALTAHLDTDRSALTVATPTHVGDPGLTYTHGRGGGKSRLDYITYSDTTAAVTAAFVLDSTIVSKGLRDRLGLETADSHASDHFPVVVDLAIRAPERVGR